ncbi:hypothetical protein PM3016_4854 [Paenibacillus mucilaginosus 3016]|uniref:2OG-Fe dioxygenase family protein n=2 Tax=Paenibacillus mucilaginosus TaxID=61624 RepID=H6NKA6_9BACL|nr:2OG-Fe dioxygenase family protein [Paenibacillus mucilaginosus]AFC31590.1 hypothetical protein PM3016_4854 [Paenibacillus mucilaginosus 3016]AFH63936.1 hypothetical protein B2K_25160 [Paenibacillus mucilaginosus K02]WFA20127.1 hypothetical protein ERY13_24255 [Paenibacillus mucilaginosus]
MITMQIQDVTGVDTNLIVERLAGPGFCHIRGGAVRQAEFFTEESWNAFADSWNRLEMDGYMGDNGKYRLRRYGNYVYRPEHASLELLPHGPYFQSYEINPLNGGIQRHFEPMEEGVSASSFFTGLLQWCAGMFDRLEPGSDWDIKIHQYRILAKPQEAGLPTPEGIHRDGTTFILTFLIERSSIEGGETGIYSLNREPLGRLTLAEPMDCIIGDDRRTMHGVTPVILCPGAESGHRDVLIAAFTKIPRGND